MGEFGVCTKVALRFAFHIPYFHNEVASFHVTMLAHTCHKCSVCRKRTPWPSADCADSWQPRRGLCEYLEGNAKEETESQLGQEAAKRCVGISHGALFN